MFAHLSPGPTFVVNDTTGEVRGIDWNFNGWGGSCYTSFDQDAQVARKVLRMADRARYKCPLIMEGGSIHVDGQGTLITTEECLLNPNRNPQCSRDDIETVLRQHLNVSVIIWIPHGLHGDDDTNGHIDNICCFVRPGVVALAWTDDPADPQYTRSVAAYDILSRSKDAKGRLLQVLKVPIPSTPLLIQQEDIATLTDVGGYARQPGTRMAASYINFYFVNGGIIMPAFNDPHDDEARRVLQAAVPERKIVQVPSREILLGGGNIHCITQQEPLGGKH